MCLERGQATFALLLHFKVFFPYLRKSVVLKMGQKWVSIQAGLQALHYAVVEDNWRVVKILLDHQADPLVVDVEGNSPLHYAASFNAIHSINKLLDKAGQFIKLNSVNSSGKAAIHLASAPDSYQAVSKSVVPAMALEALLHHHADPLLRDDDGNNALHLASKGGYVEIVKRLISTTSMPVEEKNLVH